MKKLLKNRVVSLILLMIALSAVVSLISPTFLQPGNLTNILNNSIPTIILGCGMTMRPHS